MFLPLKKTPAPGGPLPSSLQKAPGGGFFWLQRGKPGAACIKIPRRTACAFARETPIIEGEAFLGAGPLQRKGEAYGCRPPHSSSQKNVQRQDECPRIGPRSMSPEGGRPSPCWAARGQRQKHTRAPAFPVLLHPRPWHVQHPAAGNSLQAARKRSHRLCGVLLPSAKMYQDDDGAGEPALFSAVPPACGWTTCRTAQYGADEGILGHLGSARRNSCRTYSTSMRQRLSLGPVRSFCAPRVLLLGRAGTTAWDPGRHGPRSFALLRGPAAGKRGSTLSFVCTRQPRVRPSACASALRCCTAGPPDGKWAAFPSCPQAAGLRPPAPRFPSCHWRILCPAGRIKGRGYWEKRKSKTPPRCPQLLREVIEGPATRSYEGPPSAGRVPRRRLRPDWRKKGGWPMNLPRPFAGN